MNQWLVLTAQTVTDSALQTTNQVSNTSYTVLFSILSLLVCIGIPTAAILIGILKYEGAFRMTWWGILGYIVFSAILYAIVSRLILHSYLDQEATSFEAVVLVVVRIVCEVLGMTLLVLATKKKRKGFGDAILFGSGYALMECLIIGILLVAYLVVMTSDGVEDIYFLRAIRVYVKNENLVSGEEWKFLVKGLSAIVFAALQFSAAAVVFVAVHTKKYYLIGVAAIFGLLIRIPNRLSSFDAWFWGNQAVILPYLAVMAVIVSIVAYVIWKKNGMSSARPQKEGA